MKKTFVFTCILAVLWGCAKEERLNEKPLVEDGEGKVSALTFNFNINHSSLDNPATKAVKTGWEAGDKVFVFFSTVATPKHLELTFDGADWTATEMNGKNPGSLGLTEDGTMTAVYLPFGNDATVKSSSGNFSFDQTDYAYYLSCVNVPYTVSGAVVSGTLDMNVPDGFVQFFFVDADAEDGNALLREVHVTPKAVTGVNADGTLVIESKAEGTQMPGFVYGAGASKGYLFSGELADDAKGVSTAYHFNLVRGDQSKVLEGTKTLYQGTPGYYTNRAIRFPALSAWSSGDDEPIEFADANIKAKVVEAFDANSDGELSYAEAAAATSISGVFGSDTSFTSFNEFQYFTGISSIPNNQFKDWLLLESIVLPNSLTTIGNSAFYGCTLLKKLDVPMGIVNIGTGSLGGSVFYNCTSLESITIPAGITKIFDSNFYNCNNLKAISIPAGVTEIGINAFYKCSKLSSVTIPEGVITIKTGAFQKTGISSISLPASLNTIGTSAFYNSGIRTITIPHVLSIGNYAFARSPLQSIVIPDSIVSLGDSVFEDCHSLSSLTILATTVPVTGSGIFTMHNQNDFPIYVPLESLADYKEASGWSQYADRIQALP